MLQNLHIKIKTKFPVVSVQNAQKQKSLQLVRIDSNVELQNQESPDQNELINRERLKHINIQQKRFKD